MHENSVKLRGCGWIRIKKRKKYNEKETGRKTPTRVTFPVDHGGWAQLEKSVY